MSNSFQNYIKIGPLTTPNSWDKVSWFGGKRIYNNGVNSHLKSTKPKKFQNTLIAGFKKTYTTTPDNFPGV